MNLNLEKVRKLHVQDGEMCAYCEEVCMDSGGGNPLWPCHTAYVLSALDIAFDTILRQQKFQSEAPVTDGHELADLDRAEGRENESGPDPDVGEPDSEKPSASHAKEDSNG